MSYPYQTVRRPSEADLRAIATEYKISLSDDEFAAMEPFVESLFADYERIDKLYEPPTTSSYTDRTVLDPPTTEEDPLNTVITRCEIPGADGGPLEGYDIGVKDSFAVAGVEMTGGSKLLSGYIPRRDATVVTRLLDAGATITAKHNMEDLSYSGSGELSAYGPVRNPRNPEYLAGGSSSGGAAAVAEGTVDVAMGADQGGSIRMPASWCGVVGLKPTHGLVPYTGVVALDPTIDYAGPLTRTVEDAARTLDVIAGEDGLDPRQGGIETGDYLDALDDGTSDITVGVLTEGFDRPESEPAVDEAVYDALAEFEDTGVDIREVSVPMHNDGPAILTGIYMEGAAAITAAEGVGHYSRGYYDDQFAVAFGRARRTNAGDFPPMYKLALLVGGYMAEEYHGRYYARAQNLLRDLTDAYDEVLTDIDVLALPTTPQAAHPVDEDASLQKLMNRSLSMNNNTSPFNGSGHPAISVPCGTAEHDRPAGLMFVGERFDEETVLQVAHEFERRITDVESLYGNV